jgi:small subunit ribosomal protein S16
MVRIRLRRMGGKKQPSYRLVVVDIRKPRDGASVEILGNFNPRTDPETIVIKEDRALYWLQMGAQPSETVARLLKKTGIMEKYKPAPVKENS